MIICVILGGEIFLVKKGCLNRALSRRIGVYYIQTT